MQAALIGQMDHMLEASLSGSEKRKLVLDSSAQAGSQFSISLFPSFSVIHVVRKENPFSYPLSHALCPRNGFVLTLACAGGLQETPDELLAAAGFHTEPAALIQAESLSSTFITSPLWLSKRLLSSV